MAGGTGGRRRADGSRPESARDEIIRVAARLFAERGYAGTTMTLVAKAAGLRQPSLYYYFRNKEELLHATSSVNRFPAEVVAALASSGAGAPQKLYRLLFEDTKHLCLLGPLDYHQVESVAYQRPDEFGGFWADYRALFDGVVALVEAGVASLRFRPCDPPAAAVAALTLDEGLQKLHRHRTGPLVPASPFDSVDAVAHHSATTTLSSLLVDRAMLDSVRADALTVDLDIDIDTP
ncbi:helix-turn-helix domain-containing protein [Actinoplanes sp. NPDC051851]|uniref:TetR/AcrR family transcriptional regulator n=1 Tax=Actinoplanes sp. NPDC051851 TaxID=3154753 RepID=UPI00343FD72F